MFDPTLPADGTKAFAAQMRGQLNGLKELNDTLAATNITSVVVDAVNTIAPGAPASVSANVIGNTLHLTFDLPQGADGAAGAVGAAGAAGSPGAAGEVSNSTLASAIDGTSSNSNSVPNLGMTVSDPPTQAEFQALLGTVNALITALRR